MPDVHELKRRVELLEQRARRTRCLFLIAVAVVLVPLLISASSPSTAADKVITANTFQVVNTQGELVGVLGGSDDGDGLLFLTSSNGDPIASIDCERGAGRMTLFARKKRGVVRLGQSDGFGYVGLVDDRGGPALLLEAGTKEVRGGRVTALAPSEAAGSIFTTTGVVSISETPRRATPEREATQVKVVPSLEDRKAADARFIVCANCHGNGGKGDGVLGNSFPTTLQDWTDPVWQSKVTDEQLRRVIIDGKAPFMAANSDLASAPGVVQGLVDKVRSFGK